MRKVFLCALVVFGFMNLCNAQFNVKSERIYVKTYDNEGIAEQFRLKGEEAISFDIPAFIKENDHMERITINGKMITNVNTTIISFDSDKIKEGKGDHICKDVVSKKTPFLGVYGTGRKDLTGVDVKRIIPTTSAESAGMIANEVITEFDGELINNFPDLKKAVLSHNIGDRVDLKFKLEDQEYTKQVTLGSRGSETVTYKYCDTEEFESLANNSSDLTIPAVSISAYPNPTRSMTHLSFTSTSDQEITFSVTDITGKEIHRKYYGDFNGNLELDYTFNTQTNGTYILHVIQGKESYSRKVQLIQE